MAKIWLGSSLESVTMANIYVIVLYKIYQTPSQFDIMCPATNALTDSRHQQLELIVINEALGTFRDQRRREHRSIRTITRSLNIFNNGIICFHMRCGWTLKFIVRLQVCRVFFSLTALYMKAYHHFSFWERRVFPKTRADDFLGENLLQYLLVLSMVYHDTIAATITQKVYEKQK